MHNFISTITHNSKVRAGVTFTLRVVSEGMRRRLRRELVDVLNRLLDLEAEKADFHAELAERLGRPATAILLSELPAADLARHNKITQAIEMETESHIDPAYLRECFVKCEGMAIDEKLAANLTVDDLLEHGDPELVLELIRVVRKLSGLEPAEAENLKSPTTLPAQVDGKTSVTSAANASVPDGTNSGIAEKSPAE